MWSNCYNNQLVFLFSFCGQILNRTAPDTGDLWSSLQWTGDQGSVQEKPLPAVDAEEISHGAHDSLHFYS